MLIAAASLVLALIVARKAPTNRCAPLMALSGLVLVVLTVTDVYFTAAAADPALPVSPYLIALTEGSWMLYYVPLALLMLFFPTGRLLSPRWRWVVAGLVVVPAVFAVAAAWSRSPYTGLLSDRPRVIPGSLAGDIVAFGLLPVFLICLVGSAASLFLRYRRAAMAERLQLRWMAVAAMTIPLTLLLCWASYLALGTADLVVLGLAAMYLAVPLATAVALLRSTWFDVDELLVRTTVYAVLAGVVLAAIAVVSGLAGRAGRARVGRRRGVRHGADLDHPAAAAPPAQHHAGRPGLPAPGADAARGQRAAARRARRRTPAGGAGGHPPGGAGGPRAAGGLPNSGRTAFVDAAGDLVDRAVAADADTAVDIELAGDRIGLVVGTVRPAGWTVELSRVVALLTEIVRLRLETAQALQQVEASRRRLVRAQDEERVRLERDLHDGAQQRLVTLGMELRFAQRHLGPEDAEIGRLLDSSVTELQSAVAELRQIAHGLRPSSLDDGLPAALAHLRARVGVPIELQVDVGEVPEEVGVTAYFVASEAVTNAVKYAAGQRIALSVAQAPGSLTVRVQDDGRGGAVLRNGSGLAGLRDRVRALGGDLTVVSPADRGTLVEAVLPCAS